MAALAVCALVAGPAQARQSDYTLRIFVSGNGTVQGSGIQCGAKGNTCGASYALGTTVTIEATPAQSSVFAGWSGACTGTKPVCTLTAGDPTTATATFSYIEVVDVNKTGDGQGTVTSSPSGISCGYTCAAPFTGNTQVTLTARAAPGSVFVGWGGYCKGKSTCVLQQAYGTMTAIAEFQPVGKKAGYTGRSSSGSGLTVNTSSEGFKATSLGSSVQKRPDGSRVITLRFSVTKAARVKLGIWSWKKNKILSGWVSARPGPVTVRVPFSAGYMRGTYDAWAYVYGSGEKRSRMLHWKLQIP